MSVPNDASLKKPKMMLWRLLAVGCLLSLWALSLWPADTLSQLGTGFINDKVGHFVAYLILSWLLARGWPGFSLWWIWLAAFVCGAAIEVAQIYTPTRTFEWADLLTNGLGAAVGAFISVNPWRLVWQSD